MTTKTTGSTVLILLGVGLIVLAPILAVVDYNYWGGNELLPDGTLSLPGWILTMFYGGSAVFIIGVVWKLATKRGHPKTVKRSITVSR
ncbi:hypothetical protein LG284_05575 [Citricoccus nitrophenolicus]|uniref:Uncharacterized protein n=1 Tax=Citricoccus muralis TaxID=169134 RepID=A0A3D9LA53_9MICC|nr:hypothetical protein [Citricoccus muralis]REE03238.1 hypothetical protein C8E99_1044 [Citricoccus muralis]